MGVLFLKNKKIVKYSKWIILAAILLRCVQLIFFTADRSGFFIPKFHYVGIVFSFLIFELLIVPVVFSFLGRRQPSHPPSYYRSICAAAFLVALTFVIEALTNNFGGLVSPILVIPYRLFGIIGAAALAAFGCLGFIKDFNFLRGFVVSSVVFVFFRLIITFSCYSALASVTDSVFDIFMQCSQLVFMLYFAKSICFIDTDASCFAVLPTGMLTIGFTSVNVLPKLLMYIIGKSAVVHDSPVYLITNLAIGIFAAAYTYHMFCLKNFRAKKHTTKILPKDVADVPDDSFLV